jgi:hypothetical protein
MLGSGRDQMLSRAVRPRRPRGLVERLRRLFSSKSYIVLLR